VPRYFFHLRYEHDMMDGEGVDLPDFHTARVEAVRAFGEMLQELDGSLKPGLPFEMTLADQEGNALFRLRALSEMLDDHG